MLNFGKIATFLLHRLSPEAAHEVAIHSMALGLGSFSQPDDPRLQTKALGLTFPNPIGLAAGFDKNARAVRPLAKLGFGHIEAGTVTPRPQPGNPHPRLFRLSEDGAIINRMGFNGYGINRFCRNLARLHRPMPNGRTRGATIPIGGNIGINKTGADPLRDYPELVSRVSPYVDYITMNLSSPNTPGLRDLQSAKMLEELLAAINTRNPQRPPLLVKLAPDMDNQSYEPIVEAAIKGDAQGLILTNTTIARPSYLTSKHAAETGGLSGRPLTQRSREVLKLVAQINQGRIALISCGGIESGQDIFDRLQMGADMVQIYTSFVLQGPSILARLKRELLQEMENAGLSSITDIKTANK
ncbi:quinone-dependent dihydroorotate dehydrogenase [Swingsia samuiensis]|uniref:Dihydroorotate dehydrogenase (quinone) n=1 Tax=Swingsia samuiensis TaxID=1293412 RepID=A0A4Y6UMQ7_9PROT|nr:quinone-dependent dihydroorotate dehydrogenase [Swingsia samuiensis]QDH17315.1 quinone-dependent dihydroorotate dehydrogenase [Swingsia samuiensis]